MVAAELNGVEGSHLELEGMGAKLELQVRVPGLYNAYNALAAAGVSLAMGMDPGVIEAGIADFSAAFGRVERVRLMGRELFLALVKNPVGFTEVLSTILRQPGEKRVMIVITSFIGATVLVMGLPVLWPHEMLAFPAILVFAVVWQTILVSRLLHVKEAT